jgi:hypothetical protein
MFSKRQGRSVEKQKEMDLEIQSRITGIREKMVAVGDKHGQLAASCVIGRQRSSMVAGLCLEAPVMSTASRGTHSKPSVNHSADDLRMN